MTCALYNEAASPSAAGADLACDVPRPRARALFEKLASLGALQPSARPQAPGRALGPAPRAPLGSLPCRRGRRRGGRPPRCPEEVPEEAQRYIARRPRPLIAGRQPRGGGGRGGSRRPRGLLTPHSARPRSIWEHGSPSGRRGGDSCAVAAHAKCTWVRVCSCGRRAAHNSVSGAGESGAVCGRGVRAKAAVECLMLSTHTERERASTCVPAGEKQKSGHLRANPQICPPKAPQQVRLLLSDGGCNCAQGANHCLRRRRHKS